MELEKNQILITLSENKKQLTVECGAINYPVTFDCCPNKPIENIGNAIKAYDERAGLTAYAPEWKPVGCCHEEENGKCNNCN